MKKRICIACEKMNGRDYELLRNREDVLFCPHCGDKEMIGRKMTGSKIISKEKVSHELYEWIARNQIVLYYEGIPLHKFDKFELILIISKLSSDLCDKDEDKKDEDGGEDENS